MILKTTDVNIASQVEYSAMLMQALEVLLKYRKFAKTMPFRANQGKSQKFRFMDNLAPKITPLVEGVTPVAKKPTFTEVTLSLETFGDFISVTDEVGLFDVHGNILMDSSAPQMLDLLMRQAAESLDTIMRNTGLSGTNVYFAGAPSITQRGNIGANNLVSSVDYKRIVQTLRSNNVKPVTTMIKGGTGVGTAPVASSYIGLVDPLTVHDLQGLPGWLDVHRYASPESRIDPDEVGALADVGIRFIMHNNADPLSGGGSGGIDVYGDIIFGADFLAEAGLISQRDADGNVRVESIEQMPIQLISHAPGSAGTDDPLNQRSTFGWKASAYGVMILRQLSGIRYEHAVST